MLQNTDTILANLKISSLNDMQQAAAETIANTKNTILLSPTGSGKTIAFLLPALQHINPTDKRTQVLIIVPSRELAQQIETVFKSMQTGFKVTTCYGGHLRETEENNLLEAPAIIIGTPGRLADHLRRNNIITDGISTLVLDEFDKSLEAGFTDEMAFIISRLENLSRRILTSASEAVEIPDFVNMTEPHRLNFLTGASDPSLAIKWVESEQKDKLDTAFRLICFLGNRPSIVFCNHREAVERTSRYFSEMGIVNVFYHGALDQRERDAALSKFRNGSSNLLVTTDLAARGLDIPNIRYIIHFHLPLSEDIFTHRNGRTARMDASGTAILIKGPDEEIPPFAGGDSEKIILPENSVLPEKPKWITLFIGAGKKDKVNKIDIVGFLSNRGQLKKEDIGLIEVKDFFSFVAVRKLKATQTLHLISDHKIKNKKVKIEVAK